MLFEITEKITGKPVHQSEFTGFWKKGVVVRRILSWEVDISLGMENRDDIPVLNTLQNFSKKMSIRVQVIK